LGPGENGFADEANGRRPTNPQNQRLVFAMNKANGNGHYRHSKQRARILELLYQTKKHPTAMMIFEELRREFPSLSLGNVYRNLNILVEQGLVRELKMGSTFDRFDGNVAPHYHFVCEKCGEISDLDLPHNKEINNKVQAMTNGRVNYHRLEFYGTCAKCLLPQYSEQEDPLVSKK
jgi:Fe2+ or Zn2+ uptake regulation protein